MLYQSSKCYAQRFFKYIKFNLLIYKLLKIFEFVLVFHLL